MKEPRRQHRPTQSQDSHPTQPNHVRLMYFQKSESSCPCWLDVLRSPFQAVKLGTVGPRETPFHHSKTKDPQSITASLNTKGKENNTTECLKDHPVPGYPFADGKLRCGEDTTVIHLIDDQAGLEPQSIPSLLWIIRQ